MTKSILLTEEEIELIIKCLALGRVNGLTPDEELENDLKMVLAGTL